TRKGVLQRKRLMPITVLCLIRLYSPLLFYSHLFAITVPTRRLNMAAWLLLSDMKYLMALTIRAADSMPRATCATGGQKKILHNSRKEAKRLQLSIASISHWTACL